MPSRYEELSWDELLGTQRPASQAEVRDAALAAMGEGRRVPAPVRPPRFTDSPEELAELHRILGQP